MLRWFIGGFLSGLSIFIFHWFFSGIIFKKLYLDPNFSSFWRKGSGMLQFFLISIFSGLLFTLTFMLVFEGIPGTVILKGIYYGLFGWLVFLLPTYITQDIFVNFPPNIVGVWLLQSFFGYGVAGIITSLIVSPAIV